MNFENESKRHFCNICSKSYDRLYSLQVHRSKFHEEKAFKCTICSKGFLKSNQLKDHIKSLHGNVREFRKRCVTCEKRFKHLSELTNHINESGHQPLSYGCKFCEKVYFQSDLLGRHMKTYHEINRYIESSFENSTNMIETTEKEIEENSENGMEIEHEGARLEPYVCDFCEKSYTQSNLLIEHIRRFHISQQLQKALVEENHSETEEENSSDDGERETIESIQKSEHDPKILSNEKIFLKDFPVLGNHQCQTCGKSYMHYAKLDRHIKTVHMGIKKEFIWTCKLCNKIYSTAKTLEIHTKSVHEGKKFNCDSCSKAFTQRSYL